MMLEIIYAAVILVATTLGAFVGLGGGVIIKPVLDFIGAQPREQVDFLSSVSVFTMSLVSTGKAIKNKTKINKNIVAFVSAGSVIGGYLANFCIEFIGEFMPQNKIRCIQAFALAVLIAAVSLYVGKERFSFCIKNNFAIMLVGFCLGFIASFLGIGGGPVNIAVLTLFFSLNVKESAVYSVAIIFFSQLSKLASIFLSNGIAPYTHQFKTLLFILPAAVAGGIIGSKLNAKFDDKLIRKVFVAAMVFIIVLNVYNAITYFVAAMNQ